jgi:hypothetical protein
VLRRGEKLGICFTLKLCNDDADIVFDGPGQVGVCGPFQVYDIHVVSFAASLIIVLLSVDDLDT